MSVRQGLTVATFLIALIADYNKILKGIFEKLSRPDALKLATAYHTPHLAWSKIHQGTKDPFVAFIR